MALTLEIDLLPEDQALLSEQARSAGLTLEAYVRAAVERLVFPDVWALRSLPSEERNRILAAQFREDTIETADIDSEREKSRGQLAKLVLGKA